MKTILHVIDTTGPGGAETVFVELASAVAKAGHRSIALIRGPGWVQDSLQKNDIQTFVLDCKGSFNVRFLWQLIQLIRREKVDVVQSHLLGSNVYCALAGCATRVPVVASFHGGVDVANNERFLGAKFGVINLLSRAVVAVSDALAKDLVTRAGLSARKIKVIYNGIDTPRFALPKSDALRKRLGLADDALLVGALGNIRPAKAYDVLLDAFAIVAQQAPAVHLVIGGQGKGRLYDSLIAKRQQLGLESRVHFLGFVDDPAHYLSGLDVFVLSSRSEGFSIATVQAMAASLPVVATRSGGPEEILKDGQTGRLVANENPAALAEGLLAVVADMPKALAIARIGQEDAVKRFDISAMLAAYDALYQEE